MISGRDRLTEYSNAGFWLYEQADSIMPNKALCSEVAALKECFRVVRLNFLLFLFTSLLFPSIAFSQIPSFIWCLGHHATLEFKTANLQVGQWISSSENAPGVFLTNSLSARYFMLEHKCITHHAWNLTKSAIYVNEILSRHMLHIYKGLDLTLDGISTQQLGELDLQLLQVGLRLQKNGKSDTYKLIDRDLEGSAKEPPPTGNRK